MDAITNIDHHGAIAALPASSRRNALLCALLTAGCILLAHPFVDAPLGDEFSYARTALDFARTGHLVYNGWAAPLQGWWAAWGAAFIKLFGFSFNVLRMSALPFAMATVYLFHEILARFGVCARDAVLGCLTLGLSPLFFMVATSYTTDVPGILVILLCLYMCQRAVATRSDRAALLWLVFAGVVNLIAGTVRQTSWLGVLVMVPSTAWLLRRRPGMVPAGAVTALAGVAGVLACMRWADRQPFFFPEHLHISHHLIHPTAVFSEYLKALFCLLLVLMPLTAGCLARVLTLNRAALLRVGILLCAFPAVVIIHGGPVALDHWRAPWLIPILQLQFAEIPPLLLPSLRLGLSILPVAAALIMAEQVIASRRRPPTEPSTLSLRWHIALGLVGPFAIVYPGLLVARAATSHIQDRYLLGLMPSAIVLLLLLYERWVAPTLSAASAVVLCLFALHTLAATHNVYASLHAKHAAAQELLRDGVPRTAIAEGFGADLWVQLALVGYVNNADMVSASIYYNSRLREWPYPRPCAPTGPLEFEPVMRPEYAIGEGRAECVVPTEYAPVPFRAWLPPFNRNVSIGRLKHTRP